MPLSKTGVAIFPGHIAVRRAGKLHKAAGFAGGGAHAKSISEPVRVIAALRRRDFWLLGGVSCHTGYDMFQVDWFCESEFGFAQGICYAYATGYGTN